MEYKILLKANFKRHKGGLLGVFALILIACLSLSTALAVFVNAKSYVTREMERMGFGDLTAWVSGLPDTATLMAQLAAQDDVEKIEIQPLIHASYTMNAQDSDSEGQLVVYQPEQHLYRFFTSNLSTHDTNDIYIASGEIYLSPSMVSMFDAKIGDEISFSIARSGGKKSFIVKGFFEDPFMGSSMIGMKSFLIGTHDFAEISQNVQSANINALARVGAMLHLFQTDKSTKSIAEWNSQLNESTALSKYTEFAHSKSAMTDFMLLLQNIFAGFLLLFVAAVLAVSLLMLGHTISSAIQRDTVDMGILKGMGCTSQMLRKLQLLQYLGAILAGMIMSLFLALPIIPLINRITLTTTGIMTPNSLPLELCTIAFVTILCILCGFISLKTAQIARIRPLHAIRGTDSTTARISTPFPIHQKGLSLWMALRQLTSGKKHYLSALMIAVMLVFLTSMVGRVNTWLGADGKGLMDAFNPADHDIGVQRFGESNWNEIENTILTYSNITDQYLLAMPGVTVNGVDYTANVIDEPERFHILKGRTCTTENEVVLTEVAALDLNVKIGDTVSVSGTDYTVSGIYQCANDMGANLGMNRSGYAKIGQDIPEIWCTHYFLADTSQKTKIMQALSDSYGGDVHLHENAWPGLYGIISAMQVLMSVMYVVIAMVILIVVMLVSKRLITLERRNLGIYKALGFSDSVLRNTFTLRFTLVTTLGAGSGLVISALLTDPLIATVMRLCGISNFSSAASVQNTLIPALMIIILFTFFSYLACASIRKVNVSQLMAD